MSSKRYQPPASGNMRRRAGVTVGFPIPVEQDRRASLGAGLRLGRDRGNAWANRYWAGLARREPARSFLNSKHIATVRDESRTRSGRRSATKRATGTSTSTAADLLTRPCQASTLAPHVVHRHLAKTSDLPDRSPHQPGHQGRAGLSALQEADRWPGPLRGCVPPWTATSRPR